MKRNKQNAGFSLSEMLLVLGLIAILSGLAFINLSEQKKNLDFMESNETAKEIFLAAQEHLSMASLRGALRDALPYGPLQLGAKTQNAIDWGTPIQDDFYAIYIIGGKVYATGEDGNKVELSGSAYETILPFGSIFTEGNFAILYNPYTYRILCVFYTTDDYDFTNAKGALWGKVEWANHLAGSLNGESYLRNFPADGRAIVMGFYSEEDGFSSNGGAGILSGDIVFPTPPLPGNSGGELPIGLEIHNGAVLYALITLADGYTYTDITLTLKELSPKAGNSDTIKVTPVPKKLEYLVVLDDVTTSEGYFTTHSIITRGANVQATVTAEGYVSNSKDVLIGYSDTKTFNSLFADTSKPDGKEVHIENFRHLQNLSKSEICKETETLTAILDQSLGWSKFKLTDIPKYREYVSKNTNVDVNTAPSVSYNPIVPKSVLNFYSKDNRIYNIMGLELPDGNAGLFGTLSKNATIERIQMQETTVAGTPTNAGALIGLVSGGTVTVNKVASYGESWASEGTNGAATTITATGSAGGLVGKIEGGEVSLEQCAAAHLVDAGTSGSAGGLVGSVTSGGALRITYSYAGSGLSGENGRQKDNDGNLIENIKGAYAGGLIGKVEGGVTLTNSYSTASAHGTTAAGSLYAPTTATVTRSGDVYGAGSYQVGSDPINKDSVASAQSGRQQGKPYNKDLLNDNLKLFPYKSVAMMGGTDANVWWAATHMGDWPPIDNLPAAILGVGKKSAASEDAVNGVVQTIDNDNVRYAWISLKDVEASLNANTVITLAVTNADEDTKDKAVIYAFNYHPSDEKKWQQESVTFARAGTGNPDVEQVAEADAAKGPGFDVGDGGPWLRVTLDDITKSRQRFQDLFSSLNPGKEIRIRAGVDSNPLDFDSLNDGSDAVRFDGSKAPDTAYVLYDIRTKNNNAAITNVRHLQNLDTAVSGVNKDGADITAATLYADLDGSNDPLQFDDDVSLLDGTPEQPFYGISNANLREFNGNGHTLSNFTIDRTAAGATDASNAGLFRKLTNATVRNLRLEEFTVTAGTDGNAGGLAAVAEGNVTINTVLVRSKEKAQGVAANGNGAAGGLVGTAGSAAGDSLTITNSAATMYVSAANGAAGGLIGTVAQGAATVDTSYAGGHTKDGKYADKNASAAWNVASASGAAGGLVGAVASGATLKTENSFSAASVNSETAEAGGVIGATDSANVTFSGSVYSAAPVSGAARLTEQSQDENSSLIVSAKSDAGALIGKSQDGVTFLHHTYYLPQLYNKAVYYSGKNSWNIYYKGAEENAVAEVIPDQMVSYGDENTPIAGTNANNLFLEQNTLTYDDAYNPEKKPDYPVKSPEYPFKVWTKFNFDGPEGPYYYGDFEVVQNTNSVDFNVKFKYKLGDAPVESLPADSEQTVPYTRDDGLSFIPAALPLQEGYEFCRWELTKENGKILQKDGADIWKSADGASQYKRVTLNHLIVEAADPNGTRSLTFTAVYKQNPVLRTIEYWYAPDPTSFDGYAPPTDEDKAPTYGPYPTALTNSAGKAVYAPLLSASVKLRGSDTSNTEYTKLKNVEPSDPSLTGYDFLGWYTATQEGDTKWPESAKVTFDDNPADALFTGKPENEPLKLYARFDRVRYYTVEVKFAYMEGSEEKPYDNANEKFRYKERTAPDAPNPNPVPLLDTPKEIEGIYRGTDKTTNYNTEAYVTTDSTTGKKTFNVNAALESDKTESYDPKAGDAETTYTVLYEADPIEESYYRVQYVLKRTTKAEATVARPEPDYIKYEHAKDAQGRLLYVTNDGVQLYKDGDNWYYESNGEQYAGAKPQGVRGAALEVTAPNDAQYSSNENDTYPAYCPYDRGFTEDELQHFTETRKSWAEAKKTIFSESELENFPEDMQGFHHLGATGVNYTWTNPDGTRRAGTQADPYIVTYTYDRNQYTLAFNTSGGTNFDAFTRYFGEPIDNGQTMKRTAVNYDLTEGNVTLKKDSAGKSYEEENIPQTLMNVAPYHEGQRLPTPTEEKEQAFWQWRASVYTDVDATWGKRTDLRRCDEDGNAVENLMPASDMLAKANYKPAKTTYTIVILKQSVDNSVHLNLLKSNDPETQKAINRKKTYEEVESVTVEADTDTPLTNSDGEYIGKGVRLNDTEYALTNNSSFNINFTGFEYRDTECLGEMKNGVPTVAADGSSVVKVYYDREVRNILLLTNNTTGYVQTDENPVSGRQYYGYIGEKDGSGSYSYSYVKLTPETVWTISETYEAGTGDNANYGVYNNNEVIQLYYRKSAWRTSDTNYGPVYNGTRYHKLNTPSSETEDTLYDLSDTPWSREGKTLGNSYWVKNSNASDASKIYKLTLTFATNPRWFCDDKDNSAYNGKEYTGARFKTSNSGWRVRHNLVGLYEQTFTQIGLSWPPEKANSNDLKGLWWYPQSNGGGTRTTFLNAFLEENKTVLTYYGIEDSGSAHIYHYTQPLAGNYPSSTSAATNTNEISGSTGWNTNTFYFSNKYTGFTVSQYRQDNGRWQTATIDASVSNFSNLYIRHERNTYKLTVKVTGIEWVSDKVDPEDFGFTQIPGTQTYKREIDVKYEESLKDKIDSIKNAGNIALTKALDDYNKSDHGGYQYTFWCTDTLCTENVENFNNKTMPAANMTLYAKLTPPTYYVKFELKSEESNYPADEVKPTYEAKNDAGQYVSTDPAPVEVQAGSNIDSQVAKDSGGLKDEYSPISHKYDLGDLQYSFDGWYYKVNGVEKKFYSSMPITPDLVADGTVNGKTEKVLTLYPKWAYIGKTYEPVRIRCYYKDEDGVTKHYLPFSYTVKTLKNVEGTNGMEVEEGPDVELRSDEYFTVTDEKGVVNATYHADPHNIKIMPDNPTEGAKYEYEPGTRIVRVEKNGENLIELEYVNTEWTYTVNYWVRLRNVVARNGESWIPEGGFNGDNEDIAVKVWSVSVPAMGECDEAFYNQGKHGLPEMFRKGYLLLGCHYENETGESKPVPDYSALVRRTVVEGKQNVLNFYMEPDPSKISISGGNDTYNGAQHEKTLSYDLDFTPIEGLEYQIVSQYWDLSSETELKDEQGNPKAPVDAGNYSETAYIQATYTPPPSEYIRYGRLDENGDPVKDADGNVIFEELKDENGNVIQIRREMTDANRAIITSPKEKYTYLVWKSENYDKRGEYFIVTPKTVTLTSASISVPYNGGVHKAEEVRVTEGGFAEGELSLTDGTVPTNFVTFAVDAFRRNPGTTKNVFDVDFSAYPAVKEENYAITKVYGTLTVTSGG